MRISDWSSDVCSSDLQELIVINDEHALHICILCFAMRIRGSLVDIPSAPINFDVVRQLWENHFLQAVRVVVQLRKPTIGNPLVQKWFMRTIFIVEYHSEVDSDQRNKNARIIRRHD